MYGRLWIVFLLAYLGVCSLFGQCSDNQIINQGFETVDPPCGNVPPGGLINGSFNQGCMTGWEAAWGTPSVCANNPYEGNYFACLGANNEGFFQTLSLSPDSIYCLSFSYRRLNSGSGTLDVYLANGLVNQPMGNSGFPPLTIQSSWQLIGSFPSTGNQWLPITIPDLVQLDPANNQLLFLDVPSPGLDVGIDDVVLSVQGEPDPSIAVEISCVGQSGDTIYFQATLNPLPPGWEEADWIWSFGDGQSGNGEIVTHEYSAYGEYEVCLTVVSHCGCQYEGCITFTHNQCTCACTPDEDPPQFINFNLDTITVYCLDEIPNPVMPEISDCTQGAYVELEESGSGPACDSLIHYTWIASDQCGNTNQMTQVIHYINLTPPEFVLPPNNVNVSCQGYVEEFQLWLDDFGEAEVWVSCGEPNLSFEYDSIIFEGCGEINVAFTASNECGIETVSEAVFSFFDTDNPLLTNPPIDLMSPCQGHDIGEIDQWIELHGGAQATDACSPVIWTHDFDGDLTSDSVEVVFTAADACFNSISFSGWIIQVETVDYRFDTLYLCGLDTGFTDTILEMNGLCKEYFISQFFPLQQDTTYDTVTVCDPFSTGSDTLLFVNQYGCDSFHIITAEVVLPDTNWFETFTCDSSEVSIDTLWYTSSNDCDSIVIHVVLFAGGPVVKEDLVVICGQGVAYMDTSLVPGVLCDTILVTTFQYVPFDTIRLSTMTCYQQDTGTVSMVLQGADGCDSTIMTTIYYVPPDTIYYIEFVCTGPDTLVMDTLFTNAYGCDSLLIFQELINIQTDTQFVQQTTCDSSMIGTITLNIPGPQCDTIRVIETTWIPSHISRDTQWQCNLPVISADTVFLLSIEGCDSLLITEYLQEGPQMEIITVDESCVGFNDGLIEVLISGGIPPYMYSLDGGPFGSVFQWDSLAPGDYSIIVQDANMCGDTATLIPIETGASFVVDAGPDMEVESGDFIPLKLLEGAGWSSGFWQAVDSIDCPFCPEALLGPVTQAQLVYVTVNHQMDCIGVDSFAVYLEEAVSYFIPNIFSPNDDGVNDNLFLSSTSDDILIYDMIIFDRWGNQVFQVLRARSNDPFAGWNGLYRGEKLNPGVYTYIIEVASDGFSPKRLSGNVTLVR